MAKKSKPKPKKAASSRTKKTPAVKTKPAAVQVSDIASKSKKTKQPVLRFAHPFFTDVPIDKRTPIPGVGTRMVDYIATKLEPIPDPLRDPVMTLAEIIGDQGAADIQTAGSINFHITADTGDPKQDMQQPVADAMAADYNTSKPQTAPAFFLHVGDVIYYANNDQGYHEQFYDPYKKYPGKIIAVPGNHDGEVFTFSGASSGQTVTLEAFLKNFCQARPSVPPGTGSIYRQMVNHPGVYWLMQAPFVDIIGLYSNVAEGPGYISASTIGTKQKDWLATTLATIQKQRAAGPRKALLIAVHHPPYSNGGHTSSADMLQDIDDACQSGGLMPDAVFSGHSHNYQRFTRKVSMGSQTLEIPFIVVGCGGHNESPVTKPTGSASGDHTLESALRGYGYCLVNASPDKLSIVFYQVELDKTHVYDKIAVDLKTSKVV